MIIVPAKDRDVEIVQASGDRDYRNIPRSRLSYEAATTPVEGYYSGQADTGEAHTEL